MAFSWAGAAQGAAGAARQQQQDEASLEQQLAEREYRRQSILVQQAQNERLKEQMAMEQQRFAAQQAAAQTAANRDQDQRGVQRMVAEMIKTQGITPQNRHQIIGTLVEGGRMPTQADLAGPQGDDPFTLSPGQRRFGPDGKEVAYGGDPVPSAASTPQQDWVRRGNEIVPIPRGTAVRGDMPFDPVAARQAGTDPAAAAKGVQLAAEVKRVAAALRKSKGFNRAFGVWDSALPTFDQDTANAEELTKSLQSLLTLDNVDMMKGVLSDSDMKMLRQASTTLNARMGEGAAAEELDRIINMPVAPQGGGGGTVRMRAPSGEEMDVTPDQVRHYQGLGATVVGR
jgi:hypothetical protein